MPVAPFRSFTRPGATVLETTTAGDRLTVSAEGRPVLTLHRHDDGGTLRLSVIEADPVLLPAATLAAVEAIFATEPAREGLLLDHAGWQAIEPRLRARGIAEPADAATLAVSQEAFWQIPDPWLTRSPAPAYPQTFTLTDGRRHPRRPVPPPGVLYSRHIPWLGQAVSFRPVEVARDLDLFHGWMNDPRVDAFFEEAGSRDTHAGYLEARLADPHMLPLIGSFGDSPFGYFEVYWAKENRIAPFYDVQDYDRGWHCVVGEDAFRGRQFITAWLPSLMHFILLDDDRTQRIVGEPAARHTQQVRNLDKAGFAKVKTFDFPHKRAQLVMLLREQFFAERLWHPGGRTAAATEPQGVAATAAAAE